MIRQLFTDEQGMSLLEILVAVSLFSGVMLLGYMGIRAHVQAQEKVTAYTNEIKTSKRVHQQLHDWLMMMFPFDSNLQYEGPNYPLDALGGEMTFVSREVMGGDPHRIRVRHDPSAQALIALVCPDKLGVVQELDCGRQVLVPHVQSIDISFMEYFRGQKRWLNRWQRKRHLPNVIKLTMTRAAGQVSIPDLIVSPRIDQQAHCNMDPVSKECR